MTRNLLLFGQGSMACHPYIQEEFYAISEGDKKRFNRVIWRHITYFMSNLAKTCCSTWTAGIFISTPKSGLKRGFQKVARLSHAFAWMADFSLILLGGELKRRERLSARLGDAMGNLYMAMAALKVYQEQDQNEQQKVHAQWAVEHCCYEAQKAMLEFTKNFPNKWVGRLMRLVAFPFGQTMNKPSDKLDYQLAKLTRQNNHYRNRLLHSVYLSGDSEQPIDKVENTFQMVLNHAHLYEQLKDLRRYKFGCMKEKLAEKVANGELSQQDMDSMVAVEKARWDAVQVDEFDFEQMKSKTFESLIGKAKTPLD